MDALDCFHSQLSSKARDSLDRLISPRQIQDFLDDVVCPSADFNCRAIEVLRDRTAHYLDGGLFAVMCLRRLGFPPLIINLQPELGKDDDHVLDTAQRTLDKP